jgi:hypothetical protein
MKAKVKEVKRLENAVAFVTTKGTLFISLKPKYAYNSMELLRAAFPSVPLSPFIDLNTYVCKYARVHYQEVEYNGTIVHALFAGDK